MAEDLSFYPQQRVIIKGLPQTQRIANEILDLVDANKSLTDGNDLGVMDRKIWVSLCLPELRRIVPDIDMRGNLTEFLCDPKRCPSPEIVSRARRYLVQHDHIRLSKSAIENSIEDKEMAERRFRSSPTSSCF